MRRLHAPDNLDTYSAPPLIEQINNGNSLTQQEAEDAPMEIQQRADLRDYLAAERTVLAWIRTALSLMGFGFVVARFGLFLQELQAGQGLPSTQHFGMSLWFGTALIVAGVLVNLLSGFHYATLIRSLNRDSDKPHSATLAIATSLFLALVGFGMAVYLISIRYSDNPGSGNTEVIHMAPTANYGILRKRWGEVLVEEQLH